MSRQIWEWHSPILDRTLSMARWGYFGKPVVLFPTAAADCLDYERFKLIHALSPLIQAGRIKVYSCGSIAGDAWLDGGAHPAHKTWLQSQFDEYLTQELLPRIQEDAGGYRPFVAAGASLGAYNALNAATKHPEWFDLTIGMSGTYDFDRWVGSHRDGNYYFNQPMYFLPNLSEDSDQLAQLRKNRFVIATGQGRAEAPDESRRIAEVLWSRQIPAALEIWGHDVHHDWPTWRSMLPLFLDKLLP